MHRFTAIARATALASILAMPWLTIPTAAGAAEPLLPVAHKVEPERLAGTWHVVANIPVRIPFFSDADAVDYTQTMELTSETTIRLHTNFLRAEHKYKSRGYSYKGFLTDPETNAQWDVQPIWPLRFACVLFYLDDSYTTAMIGVPNRSWAWILSRNGPASTERLDELLQTAAAAGFDPDEFRRVPPANSPELQEQDPT